MQVLRFAIPKLFAFFLAGILISYYIKIPVPVASLILTLAFIASLVGEIFRAPRMFQTFTGCLTGCSLGLFVTSMALMKGPNHFTRQIHQGEPASMQLVLKERLKKTKNDRFVASVEMANGSRSSGHVLLNIRGGSQLNVGDRVTLLAEIQGHPKHINPGSFDYGRYLADKGIDGRIYIEGDKILRLKPEKNLWYYADRIRSRIINSLRNSGCRERELQVIAALLLGQQQEIAQDIVEHYRHAGAVHILSVSGLHVGFVVLIMNALMKPVPNTRGWRKTKLFITLLSLWVFAVLAGLSPSVVRSAAMFSIVCIGMNLRRPTNIYHTLIASAFIILCFQPMMIFDIGFQLSYAALFFIVWLQPMLKIVWEPQNRVLGYLWDIVTVSFAAQIGTMPLTLYYFHQFPGLFFITNLAIIPMLTVIMTVGVMCAALAFFGLAPAFLVEILEKLVFLMNRVIELVASFESWVFQDIPMDFSMMVTILVGIVLIFRAIEKPRIANLYIAGAAVLCVQAAFFLSRETNRRKNELIVMDYRRQSALVVKSAGYVTIMSRDSIEGRIRPYAVANFARITEIVPPKNQVFFGRNKIYVADSLSIFPKGKPDIILMTRSPKINLARLIRHHRPEVIVADGSNYPSFVDRWKSTCEKEKIPFHYTGEKGPFILRE